MKRHLTAFLAVVILAASIATSTASAAPPRLFLLAAPPTTTADTSAEFAFLLLNRKLNQLSSVECILDGVSGPCSSLFSPRRLQLTLGRASYAGLLPGTHVFQVRVTLPRRTVMSASYAWTIEAPPEPEPEPVVAPTVSISGGPSTSTNDTTATFQFDLAGGAPDSVLCDLDGVAAPCTSPAVYAGLALGSHTFTVTATNAAGSASDSRTWTIIGSE